MKTWVFAGDRWIIGATVESEGRIFIYRSEDRGTTWIKAAEFFGPNLQHLSMVNADLGFLAVAQTGSTSQVNEAAIWRTEDGGYNWKRVAVVSGTVFNKVRFGLNGVGVAIGSKRLPTGNLATVDLQPTVLISRDQGLSWADRSEGLLARVRNILNRADDYLADAKFSSDGSIEVLFGKGVILRTADSGMSWTKESVIKDEAPQTVFWRLDEFNGSKCVLGGAHTVDGVYGLLAVQNGATGWVKSRLKGYSFRDVAILSNGELIVIGRSENAQAATSILHSTDLGRSWSVIIDAPNQESFKTLHVETLDRILVTSDDQDVFVLERREKPTKDLIQGS
jgi:photosystem II stability/assembly factor-like uncharacterized protein